MAKHKFKDAPALPVDSSEVAEQPMAEDLAAGTDANGSPVEDVPAVVAPAIFSPTKISVRSVGAQFWRAGRMFTKEATVLQIAELTDAHLAAILAEKNLEVTSL